MNKDELTSKMTIVFAVILLFLVAAYPVSLWIKKAKNIERTLAPEELQGLTVDVEIGDGPQTVYETDIAREASRRIGNRDVDSELLIPARYNLKTFGERDFSLVGRAPWGLLTTVARNADDVEVIKYIFNNPVVVNAFMARTDVTSLTANPANAVTLAKNEYALNTFFNYDAVKVALSRPEVVAVIANSRLMAAILQGESAQYFLKNPKTTAAFISQSPTLSSLKQNSAVVNALKTNPTTAKLAPVILQ